MGSWLKQQSLNVPGHAHRLREQSMKSISDHIQCVFIASLCVLLLCYSIGRGESSLPGGCTKAVDFSLENIIDGSLFKLSDCSGKPVLMTFGSRYCKPCREMVPELNKLHAAVKASGVVVLKIDIDSEPDRKAMKIFASEMKINFPFLVGNREIARQYGVVIVPTSFLVDKDKTVVKKYLGFQPCSVFENDIKALKK